MSGKQLSEDQRNRINAIVDEWEKEMEKMEKEVAPPDGKHFDGPRTRAMIELEKKYMPMIQKIKDEQK